MKFGGYKRLKQGNGHLALTFDDGPDPRATPRLLKLLAGHGITATFFLIAQKAQKHPDLVGEILAAGHQVGNHSLTHRWGLSVSRNVLHYEISQAQTIFSKLIQRLPRFYRPPRGIHPPWLTPTVNQLGLEIAYWSLMPGDYYPWHSSGRMVRSVLKKVSGGDILVFHDGLNLEPQSDRERTLKAMEDLLPRLKDKGFQFISLAEGLGKTPYLE